MPDPGVAPVPEIPEGQKELNLMAMAKMPYSQMVQEQANEEQLQRQAHMPQQDIDRYWGRSRPPSPEVASAIGANLGRQASANNGNLDFLTDPVGAVSGMFGLDPKGVKTTLDTIATNFTSPIASAWHGLEQQQNENWQHALHPTLNDQINPQGSMALRAGATLLAGANVVGSPLVGAVATVGVPAGRALGAAGLPLPHVDVDLKSGTSNPLDPSQWKFNVRGATKEEAEQGYGDILTGVGSIATGGLATRGTAPLMPEELRGLAVDAMRRGEITDPVDVLQHGIDASQITPAMKAAIPTQQDFLSAASRLTPAGSEDAVLRVVKNLQDTWRDTGIHPDEMVRRAQTDASYRQELLQQDAVGNAVTPHTLADAPKPLPRAGKPEPAEEQKPTFGKRPNGPLFVNSVDESMAMMKSLEGSPDIGGRPQISRTGAVGAYQMEPTTAAHYGLDPNRLSDPAYNAYAARVMITDLYRRYDGNMEAMAIAYNDGDKRAQAWLRSGPGTQLDAVRDNSVRGGWRYVRVATDRDQAFLPLETQQYAARARFKMGQPEGEPLPVQDGNDYTPAPFAESPAEVALRNAQEDEDKARFQEAVDEEHERITSGGISAQSVWDDAPVSSAYEELSQNMGDQRDVEPVRGMSAYDRAMDAIWSRLQPAKAVDDLAKKAAGVDPEKEFSMLDAFRQASHSDDRANVAMGFNWGGKERGGIVVRDGDNAVRVLPDSATARGAMQQAIRDGGNPDDFMRWLVARRAAALDSQGTETPFNPLAVQRVVKDEAENKKYAKAAAIWDEFNKGVRDYAQASGRYSAEQIAGMEAADLGTWVSFNRVTGQEAGVTRRGFTVGSPVKGMKGSTEGMVGDPLSNSLDNVRQMFKAADNNRAVGKLVAMAEGNPDLAAQLGIRLKELAGDPNMAAVEKEMKAFGIPEDKWDEAAPTIASLMQERSLLADNEFAYYRDGQREVWQTGWPELANMIKGSTPIQVEGIAKVFSTIAHGLQGAVTALPDFALKMFASHQLVQFINDPLHPLPAFTGLKGVVNLMGMDGMMEDAMANGALGSTMRELDRDNHYDTMTQVLGQTGWFDRVQNDIGNFKQAPSLAAAKEVGATAVLTPFRMMRAINERLDLGNRIGLKMAGQSQGMSPLKAGAHAAEYGIDYVNRGSAALVNWWSSMVPFMRAGLLYQEQALKAIERNPAAYVGAAAIGVTLPKMGLYALNMIADDIPPGMPGYLPENEKYRNLPAWQRLYYFITPPINGQRMMLRMPDFAAFTFGAIPEATAMALHESNPAKFVDLFTTFLHDFVPPITPPAVQGPLETLTNTNLETWQPLVPSSQTGIAGQLRWIDESSGPAKALAKVLGPPVPTFGIGKIPVMTAIDHIVNSWADGVGQAALNALGAPSGHPGAPMDFTKLPFAHSFFLAHPQGGRALDDFYAEKDQFDQWAQAKVELKHEVGRGDTSNVQDYGQEAVQFAAAARRVDLVSGSLSRMQDAIKGIDANKTMTDDEKRQRTNQIIDQFMLPTAQAWTKAMREAREARSPSSVANPQAQPADQFGY